MNAAKWLVGASCSLALTLACIGISAQDQDKCTAPQAWFPHARTRAPDPNKGFQDNCDFHQWAWRMFLWQTQRTGEGRLRFMDMRSPSEMFAAAGAKHPL